MIALFQTRWSCFFLRTTYQNSTSLASEQRTTPTGKVFIWYQWYVNEQCHVPLTLPRTPRGVTCPAARICSCSLTYLTHSANEGAAQHKRRRGLCEFVQTWDFDSIETETDGSKVATTYSYSSSCREAWVPVAYDYTYVLWNPSTRCRNETQTGAQTVFFISLSPSKLLKTAPVTACHHCLLWSALSVLHSSQW